MPSAAGRSATSGGTTGESYAWKMRRVTNRGRGRCRAATHEEKEEKGRCDQARDEQPQSREQLRVLVDRPAHERIQLRSFEHQPDRLAWPSTTWAEATHHDGRPEQERRRPARVSLRDPAIRRLHEVRREVLRRVP